MSSKLNSKEVDRVAELSKLEFTGDEKQEIFDDMNKMLEFVSKLQEIDTEGIEPLIHMTDEYNVLRADEFKIDITQKEALKNAPQKDSTYFKIPKVLNQ